MMGPNLRDKSRYLDEGNCADPVQIISKPGIETPYASSSSPTAKDSTKHQPRYKWQIVWRNIVLFLFLHFFGFHGIFFCLTGAAYFKTFLWAVFLSVVAGQGITSGAHRLWAHRAYKAKLPLRIMLAVFQTIALQNDIHEWVRDHRVHHKFTDTDADPHNASRGFFFSHMGWLLVKKHKDVFAKGKTMDFQDLLDDPVVRFQKKYYLILAPLLCFGFPVFVPWYFWGENIYISWCVSGTFRYAVSLHITWLVNSAAHIWGDKPYDNSIRPTENKTVAILAFGEGWHNYHHVYPWDYKAAELGNYKLNFSTAFIDFMAKIGWAYDLKSVSIDLINKRSNRTGDGTRETREVVDGKKVENKDEHHHKDMIWGWGDKDMKEMDIHLAHIDHKC